MALYGHPLLNRSTALVPVFGSKKAPQTMQVVATRLQPPKASRVGTASGRSDTREDTRVRMYAPKVAISRLRVAFSGVVVQAAGVEANLANAYTAQYAFERSSPVDNTPALFSGSSTGVVSAGGLLISDEVNLTIPANQLFYSRVGLTVASSSMALPTASLAWGAGSGDFLSFNPEVASQTAGTGAMTNPGTGITSVQNAVPYMVLGFPATPIPSVAIFGDSIADGQNDAQAASTYGGSAFIARGLEAASAGRIPYVNFAVSSNRFQYDTAAGGASKRLAFQYFTHAIIALGTNDFGNGRTLLQVQNDLIAMAAELKNTTGPYGDKIKVAVCKLMPRIQTSTDSYTTIAGQTVYYSGWEPGGLRDQYNAWLDTIVGTTIDSVINPNQYVEYVGGNKWTVSANTSDTSGTVTYATSDGLHPRSAAHILAAQAVTTWANGLTV